MFLGKGDGGGSVGGEFWVLGPRRRLHLNGVEASALELEDEGEDISESRL